MTSRRVTEPRTRVGRVLRPGFDSSRRELIAGLVYSGTFVALLLSSGIWQLVRRDFLPAAFSIVLGLAFTSSIRDGLYLLRRAASSSSTT